MPNLVKGTGGLIERLRNYPSLGITVSRKMPVLPEKLWGISNRVVLHASAVELLSSNDQLAGTIQARFARKGDRITLADLVKDLPLIVVSQKMTIGKDLIVGNVIFAQGKEPKKDRVEVKMRVLIGGQWKEVTLIPPGGEKPTNIVLPDEPVWLAGKANLSGISASPGIATGKAYVWRSWEKSFRLETHEISDVERGIIKFEESLAGVKADLKKFFASIELEQDPNVRREKQEMLMKVEAMVLHDRELMDRIREKIRERKNPAYAIHLVFEELFERLKAAEDVVLRDRLSEMEFIKRFLLKNYLSLPDEVIFLPTFGEGEKVILVAPELNPGDIIQVDPRQVVGIIADRGGRTSHAAIIAGSMRIPAVVGVGDGRGKPATEIIRTGDNLIVDGSTGKIIVNPDRETEQQYLTEVEIAAYRHRVLKEEMKDRPSETLDHRHVALRANIMFVDLAGEVSSALDYGAEGVGLARTEYLHVGGATPTANQLADTFRYLLEEFHPYPVTIRLLDTLDIRPGFIVTSPEPNPALGVRGVRFLLQPENVRKFLLPEILAVMMANEGLGNARLQIPMVNEVGQVMKVKEIMRRAEEILYGQNIPYQNPQVGIMVETPAAALSIKTFDGHIDYASIGTNDLIQYLLAADRANAEVQYLSKVFDPAVYWVIRRVIKFGKDHHVPIEICGEMASNFRAVLLLIGMGLDAFSVNPPFILGNKHFITMLQYKECWRIAERIEEMMERNEIRDAARLEREIVTSYPDIDVQAFLKNR